MADLALLTELDLAGSGASAAHVPVLLERINELIARANPYISAELTGTGALQDVAHGLGATPHDVAVEITDCTGAYVAGFKVVQGVHDATNCKITATLGLKYRVRAWK